MKRITHPAGHLDLNSTIFLSPSIRITGNDVSRLFANHGIKDTVANRRALKRLARRMTLNAGPEVIAPLLQDSLTLLMLGFTFVSKEAIAHDQAD